MASGQAPVHRRTLGRMATVDMDRKTEDHQALIDLLVAGMTGEQTMTIGHRHHRHQVSGDPIGVMGQIDRVIFLHHQEMAAMHCLMRLATVLTVVIAVGTDLTMMSTSQAMMVRGDRESQMRDNDAVLETQAIQEKGHQMIDKIATEAIAEIGSVRDLVTRGTLAETGEMGGHDPGVQIAGTEIVITGTTTSIVGGRLAGEEIEPELF